MTHLKIEYSKKCISWSYQNISLQLTVIDDLDKAIDDICLVMEQAKLLPDPFQEDLCPYFGVLWPAAEGLSRFLVDHPSLVMTENILEIGGGLSLPAFVCSKLGGNITASDFHPHVGQFLEENQKGNNLAFPYIRFNWCETNLPGHDLFSLIIGSDILYEKKHPEELASSLKKLLKPNGRIIIADPGRSYLPCFLKEMALAGFQSSVQHYLIDPTSAPIQVFLFESKN